MWYTYIVEPDEPDYPTRCTGNRLRKCGRFVQYGSWHCDRCLKEIAEYSEEDAAHERAMAAAQVLVYDENHEILETKRTIVIDLEDLPF